MGAGLVGAGGSAGVVDAGGSAGFAAAGEGDGVVDAAGEAGVVDAAEDAGFVDAGGSPGGTQDWLNPFVRAAATAATAFSTWKQIEPAVVISLRQAAYSRARQMSVAQAGQALW